VDAEFDVTLTVPYFVSVKGRITWHPWADVPLGAVIGWKGEFHTGEVIYAYLMPLDQTKPAVAVYVGPDGDPKLDSIHAVVTIERVKR
jgi:hypothetical protein